ncbi:MAG: LuxR C-terminal-related transcriptional regulator [Candidatus Competibacteraceae bacterium]
MSSLIYIVIADHGSTLGVSLKRLLESVGLYAAVFTDVEAFMAAYQPDLPGCLLLDVQTPGPGSLLVQQHLQSHGVDLPIIIIAGHGDVPMAVAAMKQGAADFFEKPFNEQMLLDSVHNALAKDTTQRQRREQQREILWRYQALTSREQEVLQQVVEGLSNREVAEALSLSRKTVEVHRAKVMQKMQAETLSQLIRMAMELGVLTFDQKD